MPKTYVTRRYSYAAGLSALRVDGMLTRCAPRWVRALPCLGREETGRILQAIATGSARGKRDYTIVRLALATGLRCCDIVSLRLDAIDWRRDEIRIVQRKTAAPLASRAPVTQESE